jgi:hypothetical protein
VSSKPELPFHHKKEITLQLKVISKFAVRDDTVLRIISNGETYFTPIKSIKQVY